MLILFYVAVLSIGLGLVMKTLLPEMTKPPLSRARPKNPDTAQPQASGKGIEKLEILLAEKNKNIDVLQKELKVSQAQVCDFDKIKSLLEVEIQYLREQNRMFRSELGLPSPPQPEENPVLEPPSPPQPTENSVQNITLRGYNE